MNFSIDDCSKYLFFILQKKEAELLGNEEKILRQRKKEKQRAVTRAKNISVKLKEKRDVCILFIF